MIRVDLGFLSFKLLEAPRRHYDAAPVFVSIFAKCSLSPLEAPVTKASLPASDVSSIISAIPS